MECCYPVQCGPYSPAPVYIPPIQTCSMSCYQEPPLCPPSLPPPPVIFNYCVEKPPPIPRHHDHNFHSPSPQRVYEDCFHPPPPTCNHEDCGNKPPRPYHHNYSHPPNPYIQEDCCYHPKDSYQISQNRYNPKPSHNTSKHQNDLHSEYGCDPVSVNCCQPDPKRLCAPPHCSDQKQSKEPRQPEEPHYHWEPRQKNCCTPPTKPLPAVTTQNECDSPFKHIKTKYIIPCYRYEDGRIERYVPTRYGRLPVSAYRRNGIQDQMNGYRGAIRYLCATRGPDGCCVYPLPSSALKRNGIQDQKIVDGGGISYIRESLDEAISSDYPIALTVRKAKKLAAVPKKLPVTAFKRNGMQDLEHSKTLDTVNFHHRCPRDVTIECDNQPSEFMSRACEVACGWQHKKPYVESSYAADPRSEVRRYHSEDEQGNFCFHFEKKKRPKKCVPCVPVYPSPDCLPRPCPPPNRLPHPPSKPQLPFKPCPSGKLKSSGHPYNEKYTENLYA